MPNPKDVIKDETYWTKVEKGKVVRLESAPTNWFGQLDSNSHKIREITYANGDRQVSVDDGPLQWDEPNAAQWQRWKYEQDKEDKANEPQTPKVVDNKIWNPETKSFVDAPGLTPLANKSTMTPPGSVDPTEEYYLVWNGTDYEKKKNPTFNQKAYDRKQTLIEAQIAAANRGPLGRQLTPDELRRFKAEADKAELEIEQAKRGKYAQAQYEADTAIGSLAERYKNGEITIQERDQLAELIMSNYKASLKGTTPAQIQQNRQTLASGIVGNRAQAATSIGSGLLSGIMGDYSKLRSSNNPPPLGDLLASLSPLAGQFADDAMGGTDMSQLARSVLTGALGGQ